MIVVRSYLILFMLLTSSLFAFNSDSNKTSSTKVFFRENKGQIHDQNFNPRKDILYSGNVGGMTFHLKQDGLHYQLSRIDEWKEEEKSDSFDTEKIKIPSKTTLHRLDISWLGANPTPSIEAKNPLKGYDNYYLPSCPDGATKVKNYQEITYKKIYDGIDLIFHNKNNELHYDFIVSPGADYTNIKIKIKGAKKIKMNEAGDVIIQTPLGDIVEGKPIVYQKGKQLAASWVVYKNQLSFFIPDYDPNYQIIIDPPVRNWGTYYGGIINGTRLTVNTVDKFGNVFLLGTTQSTQYIATAGAFQTTMSGSNSYYISKFNVNGVRQWGTYYGGSALESSATCASDLNGNVYFCGLSTSHDIPTSTGAHQPNIVSIAGVDAFLGKLNPNGIRLWATYYGGIGSDDGKDCATDKFGNVYLVGNTRNSNFIANSISTPGSHQPNSSSATDAFLVKFDSTGTRLWATYYGGPGNDEGNSCSTDTLGNIFISGYTQSSSAISSPGAFQSTPNSLFDMFIVKFNSSGVRQWGSYFGGTGKELNESCCTDLAGNIFITGNLSTNSSSLSTPGAYQINYSGGEDVILAKFDGNGNRIWSTYFGGSSLDNVRSCAVNRFGDVFIAGTTLSNTSLSTPNAYQVNNGGSRDAFLAKFDNNGNIYWSTYYGGNSYDEGFSCTASIDGNIYLSGKTLSTNNIATAGSHQPTFGTSPSPFIVVDDFLVQFCDTVPLAPNEIFGPSAVCFNNSQNVLFYVSSVGNSFSWSVPAGATIISGQGTDSISVNFGITGGNISVFAQNSCTSSTVKFKAITINNIIPIPVTSTVLSTICLGNSTALSASGGGSYLWSTGDTASTITVSPGTNTSYTVIVSNNGCDSLSQPINISVNPTYSFTNILTICQGDSSFLYGQYQTIAGIYYDSLQTVLGCDSVYSTSIEFYKPKALINPSELSGLAPLEIFFGNSSTNANSYLWDFGTGDISNLFSPSYTYNTAGTFVVTLTATDLYGCFDSTSVTIEMEIKYIVTIPNTITPNDDGANDVWIIDNIEHFPNHSIQVFNRNGSPVFKANDYQNDWGGKYNGNDLPATTYYYVIDLGNGDEILKGDLSIIREK